MISIIMDATHKILHLSNFLISKDISFQGEVCLLGATLQFAKTDNKMESFKKNSSFERGVLSLSDGDFFRGFLRTFYRHLDYHLSELCLYLMTEM
jgi:hypothetical protein